MNLSAREEGIKRTCGTFPPEEVYKYACEDADITLKAKECREEELKKQGLNISSMK